MNTTSVSILPSWPTIWTIIGSLVIVGVTLTTTLGIKLPVLTTERAALFAIAAIGFLMCTVGGSGRVIGNYGITHPISIVGSIFGLLSLLLVASVFFGFKLPLITDDRTAFFVMAGMILLKLVINGGFYFYAQRIAG